MKTVLLVLTLLLFGTTSASADHSWGNYHWARTANPFNLNLGDNLSSTGDQYLATTSADWSQSSVLDTHIVAGGTNARRCRPTWGQVEVCNYRYGQNGWLGLAQIWVSGSHIVQGLTKVNDTYFNTATYNTPPWKNLVMCQEVGHTLGLDHQDENFNNANLGTCMDYTANPDSNQHPNAHDYEQLEAIYSHLESSANLPSPPRRRNGFLANFDFDNPREWGQLLKSQGRTAVFERAFNGNRVFTFIILADTDDFSWPGLSLF